MGFRLSWSIRASCTTARAAGAGLALAALGLAAGPAAAQEESSTNRVATETDWSVFVEDDPTECWAVSQPKETVNTRDGRVVAVRRGDILLFVFYRPSANVAGQVSFTGGYPFAEGSTVEVEISGNNYSLYTDGEWAWPATPEEDARIVAAMRAGATATLTARSSRGTTTKDTFSLLGFTAASQDAEQRCGG
jgi:invasion protein IalB